MTANSPNTGPHCPKTAIMVYPPPLRLSVAFIFATHANINPTLANMHVDRNTLKYRGAVVSVVAFIVKPTAAMVAESVTKGPRTPNLSLSQQKSRMTKKHRM